jgi:broad specificity phosphatase PhoE
LTKTVIHLLRHGEVENPDGVVYERLPDFHLSKRGQDMAEQVAKYFEVTADLNDISAVYSSPLTRAIETATPVAKVVHRRIKTDERLIEAKNSLAGKNPHDYSRYLLKHFKFITLFKTFSNPLKPSWGEPYFEIAQRMKLAIDDIRKENKGKQVLIVSHESPIWCFRRYILGRHIWHNPAKRVCQLASLTTFVFDDESEEVEKILYRTPARNL